MKITVGAQVWQPETIDVEWYGPGADGKTTKLELRVVVVNGVARLWIGADDEILAMVLPSGDIHHTAAVPGPVIRAVCSAGAKIQRLLEPYRER